MTRYDKNALIVCGLGLVTCLGVLLLGRRRTKSLSGYADVKDTNPSVLKGEASGTSSKEVRSQRMRTRKAQCVSPKFPSTSKFSQHTMLVRTSAKDKPRIESSWDAAKYLGEMAESPQEDFTVLYINTRGRIIGQSLVSRGTSSETLVDPPDVFRPALLANAKRVILAHNHPSGETTPSPQDIKLTQRLSDTGEILGIRVLDHIIMGEGKQFSSLRDLGLIK